MHLLETMWQDARRGCRALAKTPGFTLVAVLTLALGIGANTAIFSVVKAVLLEPLPYADPDARVMIWSKWVSFDKTWVSEGELLEYRKRSTTMRDIAAWSSGRNLTGDGESIRVGAAFVTANTFAALSVEPLLGRTFTSEEDVPNNDHVILLSHGLWQRRYGGDQSVIGNPVQIDGRPRTVIGIMPPGFQLPTDFGEDSSEPTQMWMPLAMDMKYILYGSHGLYAAARLVPGATPASATAELRAMTESLTTEGLYPREMEFTAFAVSLREEILGQIRPAILLLFGAVAFLLLIACANVANLLLARAEGRQREMALRCALGAGQWRLFRQLITESLVLSIAGGVVGVALAYAGTRALVAVDPAGIPRASTVTVDAGVLVFTGFVAILTSLFFSLAPAVRAFRADITEALKESGQHSTAGGRRQRVRRLLVVGEMALAVVLVIGAGLMLRSLWTLQKVDLGFNPANVLTLRLSLPEATYEKPEQVTIFYRELLERVRALPGVQHAGIVRSLPLGNTIGDWGLRIEGYVPPRYECQRRLADSVRRRTRGVGRADHPRPHFHRVGYCRQPACRARQRDAREDVTAGHGSDRKTNAHWRWRRRPTVGDRCRTDRRRAAQRDRSPDQGEVLCAALSMVRCDWKFRCVDDARREAQLGSDAAGRRYSGAGSLHGSKPADSQRPIDARGRRQLDFDATVYGFAAHALRDRRAYLVGSRNLWVVLSFLVSQCTQEIGIRLAIGADEGHVLRMVLGQGLVLAVVGVGLGVLTAFIVTRLMAGLLYGVGATDPLTFVIVPLGLCAVALVASYIPARRAMRVDPLAALRSE